MKTNIVIDISPPILFLAKFSSKWCYHFGFVCPGMPKLSKITSLLFFCNILRKKWVMSYASNNEILLDTMKSIGWPSILKAPKIAILQHLKKKLKTKLIFCMQINIKFPTSWFQHFGHQSFLQGDAIMIDGHDQAFSNKISSTQNIQKVNGVEEWSSLFACR